MTIFILRKLRSFAVSEKAKILSRFFKTGKGEYGEGDKFLGVVMPDIHKLAKRYFQEISLEGLKHNIKSEFHEERMFALLSLVYKYELAVKKGDFKQAKNVFKFYLKNKKFINNWDLVDVTAPKIVGHFIYHNKKEFKILEKLASSKKLWDRRIAIISLFYFIRHKDCKKALVLYKRLLNDDRDLIHKAIGWMLREIGKNCGEEVLEDFLNKYKGKMARITLRYAIEKFSKDKRMRYL